MLDPTNLRGVHLCYSKREKNGSLSLCVNYRGLHKFPIKNKYPTPIFDELVDHLSGAKKFSNFDLKIGCNQLRIKVCDLEKNGHS